MKRGTKPKPTALKLIQGNPGKRRLNKKEPRYPKGAPKCPGDLDIEARREWFRVVPKLEALGILSELDHAVLTAYCFNVSLFKKARRQMLRLRSLVIVNTKGNLQPNPYIRIARDANAQMHRFAAEFGFTPSTRSRLEIPAGDGEDDGEFFD